MKLLSLDTKTNAPRSFYKTLALLSAALLLAKTADATPYASNVRVSGTTVTFVLNEPADVLQYSINSGPPQTLDGSTKGTKTFNLTSASDKFSIIADKNSALGYTVPLGTNILTSTNGLYQDSMSGGFNLISEDSALDRFNSPRGVSVNNYPGSPNFGTVYIANSAAGTTAGRTLGDGLYALRADQSDAFGYGDSAQNPNGIFSGASASSPFRTFAATNGEVYVADFSDVNGNIFRLNSDLTAPTDGAIVFEGIGGPTPLPAGQNHGSTLAVHVSGTLAGGDLTVYTIDEDLGAAAERNSLWSYNIGSGPLPSNVAATKINQSNVLVPLATSDMQHGNDGKWYLAQNRTAGTESGVFVLDANGATLFSSLSATRTLLGNPTAPDIFRNVQGMAVSEDQKWIALMLNNSDVAVVPLVDGIPDIANRLVVNTGTDINSGRDIAFDAAGNIHYVSSGQALYRVISPGGSTRATTTWNGTAYSFAVSPLAPALNLTITPSAGQVKLEWTGGVLQEATSVTGPWNDSATQTSPYIVTPSEPMKFFRLRGN